VARKPTDFSPPTGNDRKRRRSLTRDEAALWRKVTEDATPRPGRKQDAADPVETTPQPPKKNVPLSKQARRSNAQMPIQAPAPKRPAAAPPLNALDNRTAKRLVRGQLTPDARLDLHGATRHSAEPTLLRFVTDARAQGKRLVLVITGKGAQGHMLHGRDFHADPDRRSVLRDMVPRWLNEPQFRTHVAGFQPAHPKHGGGGALYLWLRRHR
jgi:DNA-nicking Smr family endonuclease